MNDELMYIVVFCVCFGVFIFGYGLYMGIADHEIQDDVVRSVLVSFSGLFICLIGVLLYTVLDDIPGVAFKLLEIFSEKLNEL